jgi:hypothetical protein
MEEARHYYTHNSYKGHNFHSENYEGGGDRVHAEELINLSQEN